MSMINAKPRFAVHENGQIYDYNTGLLHDADGTLETPEGVYDLAELKDAIIAGKPISIALDPAPAKSSAQANADFEASLKAKLAQDQAEHEAAVARKQARRKAEREAREAAGGNGDPSVDGTEEPAK